MSGPHIDPVLVAEGRALLQQEGNLNWRWGDLVARVMPPHSPDRGQLVEWAEQIGWFDTGRTLPTLLFLRTVALAWPEEKRLSEVSFTVHAELAAMPNRFELIRPGLTKRQARVLAGKKPEIGSKEQRGEVVAGLLTDPQVLAQLADNPEFSKVLRQASLDVEERQEADVEAARRERAPGLHRADEVYSVFAHLARARREIVTSVKRFADVDDPLDGHRAQALRLARQVHDAAEIALDFFEGQASLQSLEDALAIWTAEEAAEGQS
jgi:hypothetical protein